jgi:hypothetical protein
LAAGLAVAGCDSSLPALGSGSDWAQREQDRNDTDALIDDILGNPKRMAQGDFNFVIVNAPPAGLGRAGETPVWSEAAEAWVAAGVTLRNDVDWDWTLLIRILDGNGNPQQQPNGSTERIDVVMTTDGERATARDGLVIRQTSSWVVLGEITGLGSGTLDVSVVGALDSREERGAEITEIPAEFRAEATVPENTDDCPTGDILARIADFTVLGTFDPVGGWIDWEAYVGDIEPGEEPFDTESIPFECEPAP